jgi:steroid delta-isomerase-like uncharacterized protein
MKNEDMRSESMEVIHRWFEEVWNQGREEAIDEMFAEDGVAHGLAGENGQEPRGPAEFKPFFRSFRGALPDIRVTVEDCVTEGDKAAVRCRITASHRGDGLGLAATGNAVEFDGICIVRVLDGKIVEAWNNFDFLSLNRQIGLG